MASCPRTLAEESAFGLRNDEPIQWPFFVTWKSSEGVTSPWYVVDHIRQVVVSTYDYFDIDTPMKEQDRLNAEYWEKQ
jgi:hypothetical protein